MSKINKIILSENIIYKGIIKMPDGWEVKKDDIVKHITASNYYTDYKNPFCKEVDRVETYILDYLRAEQKLQLKTGFKNSSVFYEKNERSKPEISHNYCDYVCLYGVETDLNTCKLVINFDNNIYSHKLETNNFIIMPSKYMYYIENTNNSYLNFIQKFFFSI
jgi:hypothetical protein